MIKELINKYRMILTYLVSAGLSFGIDIAFFSIFMLFNNNIILNSYLARTVSSIINYILNKKFVFKSKEKTVKTAFSYFILVITNITISGLLVSIINNNTGINATIIKVVIDSLIFISNYFLQKYLIFKNSSNNTLYKYIMPFISFIALFIHFNNKGILFNYNIYDYIIMPISLALLYFLYLKIFNYKNDKFKILSIIFSIFMIIGYSYNKTHTYNLIFNKEIFVLINLVKLFGFYHLIKNVANIIYEYLLKLNLKEVNESIKNRFSKHPFIYSFIILLLFYLIYLISYYPGVLNYDNANQIKEVLGVHTRYLDSVIVINPNITLTNFNPIIHTLLLGNLYKFGVFLGSGNFGLFMYTFIQMTIMAISLAYSIYFLYKENIKIKYLLIILLLYILLPYYPFYSITCVKDTYWTAFFILYLTKIYKLLKHDNKTKDYLILMGIIILLILFRNNGIIAVICSLPLVLLFNKKVMRPVLVMLIITIGFSIGYAKTLKLLEIPNTSPREALSVPFQQTARYVKDYPDDVTKEEKESIDRILTYETLATRYKPELSDKVKNKYNIYTTKDDLKTYFKNWLRMGLRHPDSYINATLSNNYGYIYPDVYGWYFYCNLNKKIADAVPGYHFNTLIIPRLVLSGEAIAFTKIPILSLFVSCGFWTWFYIFLTVCIFMQKKKELIVLLFPIFSLIFMCIIGPANTYFRYVYPYAAAAPLILMLILIEININIKKEKDYDSKK